MKKPFEPGDRVLRTETGEKGVVRRQFIDGAVALEFDDGRLAELDFSRLQRLPLPHRKKKQGKK